MTYGQHFTRFKKTGGAGMTVRFGWMGTAAGRRGLGELQINTNIFIIIREHNLSMLRVSAQKIKARAAEVVRRATVLDCQPKGPQTVIFH